MQRIRIECQLLGHEADFDKRLHSILEQPIVNLVNVREVVDGISVLVLVVNSDLIVQNRMKSHIAKVCDLLHRP